MITFADRPEEIADFTSRSMTFRPLVYAMPRGRTALLDAIYLGVTKNSAGQVSEKALLIISDGGDNHSRIRRRDPFHGQRGRHSHLRYRHLRPLFPH